MTNEQLANLAFPPAYDFDRPSNKQFRAELLARLSSGGDRIAEVIKRYPWFDDVLKHLLATLPAAPPADTEPGKKGESR